MDIFGDDIDTLLQNDDDGDGELNENIRSEDIDEENEDAENKTDSEPIKVEPKKRAVRNPQLRLNVERLKSERGIHTVEKYCADLKFRGKGHEREDLNNIMKRLEHWAHRLYPNYKFDDFIGVAEKLGRKKQMQTHMYRYRQGLLDVTPNPDLVADNEVEEAGSVTRGDDPIDELDEIIDQQIQNYSHMVPRTPAHETTFDSIRSSMIESPRLQKQIPIESSTPFVARSSDTAQNKVAAALSSEQMARIAENRRLAQERLMKKKADAESQPKTVEIPQER